MCLIVFATWFFRYSFKDEAISTAALFGRAPAPRMASCFAPFTQKLGVRLSKLTYKRGRRSAKSIEIRSQWQAARKYVQDQAFYDRVKGESVCRSTSGDVADYLAEAFGQPLPEAIPNVEHGSVLTDSRGEGAFQLQITCPAIAD